MLPTLLDIITGFACLYLSWFGLCFTSSVTYAIMRSRWRPHFDSYRFRLELWIDIHLSRYGLDFWGEPLLVLITLVELIASPRIRRLRPTTPTALVV